MFISLQDLEVRVVHFKVDLPVGQIDFDPKLKQSSDLHAEGSAQLLNASVGDIRVSGKLLGTMESVCDRCVESAAVELDNQFDLVYMPSSEARVGGEDEIDKEGIEVGYYDGRGLELNDVLREVVLLALPMQLVCQDDCKGICPVCGQNRNQTDCGCEEKPANERWSKLKMLRTELGSQN